MLCSSQRGRIRESPGVGMKHGRYRHVNIPRIKPAVGPVAARRCKNAKGVQHELTMAEIHALGMACCARRVEGCSLSVFIEVLEIKFAAARDDQIILLPGELKLRRGRSSIYAYEDKLLDRFDFVLDPFQDGQEIGVDQYDVIFGMVDGIENLFR